MNLFHIYAEKEQGENCGSTTWLVARATCLMRWFQFLRVTP